MAWLNKIFFSTAFLFIFFGFRPEAFSNPSTCLSFYDGPATIEKLNAELQRQPYSSPILVLSQFLRDETASIERQYAEILGYINQAETKDRLGTLIDTTQQLVTTITEQVRKLAEELDRKKPSQDSIEKLSSEIKKCYGTLGKCQDSLYQEVLNADRLFQQDNALKNQIDQTSAQLNKLSLDLRLLNSESPQVGAEFSNFVLLKVQSLQGYISVLNAFLQKQGTLVTVATMLVEHTAPELERKIIEMEARGVKIGVLEAYLNRIRGPKEVEVGVHVRNMDDPIARPFERTSYGEQFIRYLEENSKKIDEKKAQEKFFEILNDENHQFRRLSLADAYDIYRKLNELRIALPTTQVQFFVNKKYLTLNAWYLVLDFKGVSGDSFSVKNGKYFDKQLFESTRISNMRIWMENKIKNFIVLFYLTGGIFSPENKGMRREFVEFFRNDVLSNLFQTAPFLHSSLIGKFFSRKSIPILSPEIDEMTTEISNVVATQSEKLVQNPLMKPDREVEIEIFMGNRNVKFTLPKGLDF